MSTVVISDEKIDNINGLQYATNLKQLVVVGKGICDLSPIKNLTKLVNLDLPTNNISDLSPLSNLPELITLDVSSNNMGHIDSSVLDDMKSLKTLRIDGNSAESGFDSLSIENL